MKNIRVMIVDSNVTARRQLASLLATKPELEILGSAANPKIALLKIPLLRPDILILDVSDPRTIGVEGLDMIKKNHKNLPIIVFSVGLHKGSMASLDVLFLGADDYVSKPDNEGDKEAMNDAINDLVSKIKAIVVSKKTSPAADQEILPKLMDLKRFHMNKNVDIIVIGASTGGPKVLTNILEKLPENFSVPVLIVQHMLANFTSHFVQSLNRRTKIEVREGVSGAPVNAAHVWIAPGDRHMRLRVEDGEVKIQLDQTMAENSCRPAVDVLFRSCAEIYGANVLGIILTGMGQDGKSGAAKIRQKGGAIFAQDKNSSVVWGMPGLVVKEGLADGVMNPEEITEVLLKDIHQTSKVYGV